MWSRQTNFYSPVSSSTKATKAGGKARTKKAANACNVVPFFNGTSCSLPRHDLPEGNHCQMHVTHSLPPLRQRHVERQDKADLIAHSPPMFDRWNCLLRCDSPTSKRHDAERKRRRLIVSAGRVMSCRRGRREMTAEEKKD